MTKCAVSLKQTKHKTYIMHKVLHTKGYYILNIVLFCISFFLSRIMLCVLTLLCVCARFLFFLYVTFVVFFNSIII